MRGEGWSVACEVKDFRSRYEHNLLDSTYAILEGDELSNAIRRLMDEQQAPWIGSAAELAILLKRFGFAAENPRSLSNSSPPARACPPRRLCD